MTDSEYLTNDEWVRLLPFATNCAKWAKILDRHSVGLVGGDLRLAQRCYNYLMRNAMAVHHGRHPKRDKTQEQEVQGLLELIRYAELDGMRLDEWMYAEAETPDTPLID